VVDLHQEVQRHRLVLLSLGILTKKIEILIVETVRVTQSLVDHPGHLMHVMLIEEVVLKETTIETVLTMTEIEAGTVNVIESGIVNARGSASASAKGIEIGIIVIGKRCLVEGEALEVDQTALTATKGDKAVVRVIDRRSPLLNLHTRLIKRQLQPCQLLLPLVVLLEN
jgi:hypothetical protein